jgi:hypothetical protein
MPSQFDKTHYYVTGADGQPIGPYTFPQLTQLWRSGQITAAVQFWTEASQQWQPISKLHLDAPDTEEANARIWKVLTPENGIQGPFLYLELAEQLETGRLSPRCKFWFPGLSRWIDTGILGRIAAPDSEEEFASLRDLNQLTPPPIHRQRTEVGQAGANLGSAIGQLVCMVILLFIVVFAFKSCTGESPF